MIDIDRVIKGIRKCLSHKPCSENGCPYENECAVEHLNDPLLRDALKLLKEYKQLQGWSVGHGLTQCKDCKYGEKLPTFYHPNLTWCNKYERSHDDDWFCADGVKRE